MQFKISLVAIIENGITKIFVPLKSCLPQFFFLMSWSQISNQSSHFLDLNIFTVVWAGDWTNTCV